MCAIVLPPDKKHELQIRTGHGSSTFDRSAITTSDHSVRVRHADLWFGPNSKYALPTRQSRIQVRQKASNKKILSDGDNNRTTSIPATADADHPKALWANGTRYGQLIGSMSAAYAPCLTISAFCHLSNCKLNAICRTTVMCGYKA